ncbi:uncharacterized protein IL334_001488 [Kwoniella shivajii]|uniref:Palmitoyltransferase n=1 Tax=Kwoniella shivajii TaxID=564305 RepID=A0ABZ1CS29_9TREE|nr:hypothetical protein IL334_001488 [Kwoniella shivajii]
MQHQDQHHSSPFAVGIQYEDNSGFASPPSNDIYNQNLTPNEQLSTSHAPHRSAQRYRNEPWRPDPWIPRKSAVVVVLALMCWSFYVIVGRVCTPMVRGGSSSGLGKSAGVGLLIGYVILWLLVLWTYVKILITGPGLATKNFYTPSNFVNRVPEGDDGPQPSELAPVGNLVHDVFRAQRASSDSGTDAPLKGQTQRKKRVKDWREVERPLPPLSPPVRWCRHCQIIKPDRTHHCRHCGTCILQFDHHCLWIGQCVGWANHKIIGLIVVSAMFGLFTAAMFISHVYLILNARTNVESFASRDQHEAESRVLQEEYGYFLHNTERRKVQKKWKEEWGGSNVGSRWAFGSKLELWEQEMGKNRLGWILPLGRPLGDGIHYEKNPKFGPNGEWLKKKDWPKDLQA